MKKGLIRFAATVLALTLLCVLMSSCANLGTPLLKLEIDGKTYTYSVNLYELQLATIKGQLVASGTTVNGYNAQQNMFWNSVDEFDGQLQELDTYYCTQILDECRYILVSLYLFDHYGLSLSESEKESIEIDIEEFIKTDGDGSENKLNSILAQYNINVDMLREHLVNTAKVRAVREYLYSRLGTNVKDNYMKEHYVHFDQLFLANYSYVYVTDEFGDDVYYDADSGSVAYKETPYFGTDKNGNTVYYTDINKTHYSYDTENGTRTYQRTEDGGGYETKPMTEEELKDLENRADLLLEAAQGLTPTQFSSLVADEGSGNTFDDGYYLKKDIHYSDYGESYLYLDQIMEKLEKAEVGDVVMVESESGYHIVMKQAHTEKAYELDENQTWFESSVWGGFTDALTQRFFLEESAPYYEMITLDQKVYATAANMKSVKENYYYY